MPYSIRRARSKRNPWKVVNKRTGKVMGKTRTKQRAKRFMKALYSQE